MRAAAAAAAITRIAHREWRGATRAHDATHRCAARREAPCATGIAATFVRPWYVLGPGHRSPYLLLPFTRWRVLPASRDTARRLGLVTLHR